MPKDIGEVLGSNLKRIRKALKLSQEQFADLAGMTQPSISRLERAGKKSGREDEGWHVMRKMAETIEQAGGNPMDLLLIDGVPADQVTHEIQTLLGVVDADARDLILSILRREAELARLKSFNRTA